MVKQVFTKSKSSLPDYDLEFISSQSSFSWELLRNESIFLTGATGFFGRWIVESFIYVNNKLNLNARLTLLTRDKFKFLSRFPHFASLPELSIVEGDVKSFTFPQDYFSYLIHAATESHSKENNLTFWQTIVDGTNRVLQFAQKTQIQKFLYISSGAVYGQQTNNVSYLSETQICQPQTSPTGSIYAIGKYTAEQLCFLYAQNFGMDIKIARCFAFVGPHIPLKSSFAIANFIADGLRNDDIIVQGDGSSYRSYLYMTDLVIWLWTILFKGRSIYPYNVGSDQMFSIKEVADLVASCFSYQPKVIVCKSQSFLKTSCYVPNIERAKQELNLVPKVGLLSAIQSTINWHQSEGYINAN